MTNEPSLIFLCPPLVRPEFHVSLTAPNYQKGVLKPWLPAGWCLMLLSHNIKTAGGRLDSFVHCHSRLQYFASFLHHYSRLVSFFPLLHHHCRLVSCFVLPPPLPSQQQQGGSSAPFSRQSKLVSFAFFLHPHQHSKLVSIAFSLHHSRLDLLMSDGN